MSRTVTTGTRAAVRAPVGGVDRGGPGGAVAAAEHVGADDEVAVRVEPLAGADHHVPPSRLFRALVEASGVRAARQRMAHQDRVVARGVQVAVGSRTPR